MEVLRARRSQRYVGGDLVMGHGTLSENKRRDGVKNSGNSKNDGEISLSTERGLCGLLVS